MTILMWNNHIGAPLYEQPVGLRTPFEQMGCPVTNCELTTNRSQFDESSLILFHVRSQIDYFPDKINASLQRFVHLIYESPVNCHLCPEYADKFDLTASYRKESDFASIYWTDSGLEWANNSDFKMIDFHSNKTEFAAALVSHCVNDRFIYLKELQNYINLRIYGKCGIPCTNCRQYIGDNYKFFFVFENSICNDYVTEKLFETLKFNIIPVVMGGADYSYYLPKSGYINALDFTSPMELAKYLIYLDGNKEEYNKYFEWKRFLKVGTPQRNGFLCEMCIQLHLEDKLNFVTSHVYNQSTFDRMYGLKQNCKSMQVKKNLTEKIFNFSSNENLRYSGFMSP